MVKLIMPSSPMRGAPRTLPSALTLAPAANGNSNMGLKGKCHLSLFFTDNISYGLAGTGNIGDCYFDIE